MATAGRVSVEVGVTVVVAPKLAAALEEAGWLAPDAVDEMRADARALGVAVGRLLALWKKPRPSGSDVDEAWERALADLRAAVDLLAP